MTLAIVDDDEDVRRALARLLRSLGHDVHVFGSAEEFEAETVAVDCLILDVRMPGLSGPNCANGSAAARPRLPSSSSPGTAIRRLGTSPPAIDTPLVTKPFDDVDVDGGHCPGDLIGRRLRERHAH